MGKANQFYDSRSRRWTTRGGGGQDLLHVYDNGTVEIVTQAKVGGGGNITKMFGFIGSSAGLSSVASEGVQVGTITNASDVAIGDKIFGVPKGTALQGANVALSGFRVPTTGLLNVDIANPGEAGSLAALGWDIFAIRGG